MVLVNHPPLTCELSANVEYHCPKSNHDKKRTCWLKILSFEKYQKFWYNNNVRLTSSKDCYRPRKRSTWRNSLRVRTLPSQGRDGKCKCSLRHQPSWLRSLNQLGRNRPNSIRYGLAVSSGKHWKEHHLRLLDLVWEQLFSVRWVSLRQ